MNSPYTKACIFLAFFFSFLANWQISAEENFSELGPVSIRGHAGNFEILVNGQLFSRDKTWYVSTVDGFPSRKNPRWVLISYSNGGTCCPPSYRILDLTQETPRLSAEFYSNNYIFTGQQVIFDNGQDAWAYDQHGLAKLPTLSMEAKLQEGIDAYKRGEYAKALRFLWPLRSQKSEASYYLGLSYLSGHGFTKNYLEAKAYFQVAAEMGNTHALFQLANMYSSGFGSTPPNTKLANELYLEGANLGDGDCQLALGVQLANGGAGGANLRQAFFWIQLAKDRLSKASAIETAQKHADLIEAQLSAEVAQQVRSEVDFWKPKEFSLFGSAASLRAWEEKYPFSRVKGLQFFEVPEISVRVETALGEEAVKAMKVMSTSPDIKERDGWLIATGCTPHACVDRWSVLINLKTYDVFACLRGYFMSNSIQTEVFGGTGFQRIKRTLGNNFNEGECAEEVGPTKFLAILSPKKAIPVPSPSQEEKGQNILSLGTGFFIAPRYLLSNNHVVADCRGPIHARYPDKPWFFAKMAGQDKTNDLALLYTETESISFASFRFGPRLGDSVAAYGFPYPGVLSASGNFTMGNVTSLSGMGDDTRFLQMSTPVQPGNSGGPLVDMSGSVIGVVESQLNAVAVMQAEKSVPQNVNFGIQVPIVVNFLSVKGVVPKIDSSDGPKLTPSDVADLAKRFTVQLYCEEEAPKASGKAPKLLSRSKDME